jgi:hypothetical protein
LPTVGKDSVTHPPDEAHDLRRGRRAMSEPGRGGGVVLNSREQRVWDDVLLFWSEGEAEETPGAAPDCTERSSKDGSDPPLAVVAGIWIVPTLVIFGAMTAALALGVATAVGWALWHHWPRR